MEFIGGWGFDVDLGLVVEQVCVVGQVVGIVGEFVFQCEGGGIVVIQIFIVFEVDVVVQDGVVVECLQVFVVVVVYVVQVLVDCIIQGDVVGVLCQGCGGGGQQQVYGDGCVQCVCWVGGLWCYVLDFCCVCGCGDGGGV